jgi:hypothetical protein
MKIYNNIVITGANSSYFESLLTLISSIHKDSFDLVDMIVVYDFGLDQTEISQLKLLKKIMVFDITKNFQIYDGISSIKTKCHFLKMYSLFHSTSLSKNVLWLDAGVCALRRLDSIFNIIESEDIFLVGDIHLNKNYTHNRCIEVMNATEKELMDKQLCSGIFGFKSNGKYNHIIIEGWEYAQIEGCIDGFENNHRHDQSVLSILSSRYDCPTQDIDIFGYWTDVNRNLEKAIELNSVIFVHRRGYDNKKNLIYEN